MENIKSKLVKIYSLFSLVSMIGAGGWYIQKNKDLMAFFPNEAELSKSDWSEAFSNHILGFCVSQASRPELQISDKTGPVFGDPNELALTCRCIAEKIRFKSILPSRFLFYTDIPKLFLERTNAQFFELIVSDYFSREEGLHCEKGSRAAKADSAKPVEVTAQMPATPPQASSAYQPAATEAIAKPPPPPTPSAAAEQVVEVSRKIPIKFAEGAVLVFLNADKGAVTMELDLHPTLISTLKRFVKESKITIQQLVCGSKGLATLNQNYALLLKFVNGSQLVLDSKIELKACSAEPEAKAAEPPATPSPEPLPITDTPKPAEPATPAPPKDSAAPAK